VNPRCRRQGGVEARRRSSGNLRICRDGKHALLMRMSRAIPRSSWRFRSARRGADGSSPACVASVGTRHPIRRAHRGRAEPSPTGFASPKSALGQNEPAPLTSSARQIYLSKRTRRARSALPVGQEEDMDLDTSLGSALNRKQLSIVMPRRLWQAETKWVLRCLKNRGLQRT